jgi:hypothetical protein
MPRAKPFKTGAAPTWHLVGDSHVEAVRHAAALGLLEHGCAATVVGGATAVGLRNPNSATDAIGAFRRALLPARDGVVPVIHLGEVDCGFVIWYRADKHGESVESQFDRSVAAYMGFVDELLDGGYGTVVVTGASIPTIRDGQDWGEVANARREVTATLRQRTDLTFRYNERLSSEASKRGLPLVDLAGQMADPATGVISDAYRHPNPTDHHADPDKTAPLWAAGLNAAGRTIAARSGRLPARVAFGRRWRSLTQWMRRGAGGASDAL